MHRDIKPENVVIQKDGVKLTDFGLATLVSILAALLLQPMLSAHLLKVSDRPALIFRPAQAFLDERYRERSLGQHLQSPGAAQIKLADKTSNIEDIIDSPPRGWSLERRARYLDWAEAVVEAAPETDVFHAQSLIVLPVVRDAAKRLGGRFVYDVADYHTEAARLARMPWVVREVVRRRRGFI